MGLLFLLLIGLAIWVALGTLAILHRLTHPLRLSYGVAVARSLPLSPAELGMDFQESELTYPDGTQTPLWIVPGGKADGPCIVVTHGWGHSRFAAVNWMKVLHPYASRLIAYDLRGQGESTAKKTRLGTTEVDDLLYLLQHVAMKPEQGQPPASLVLAGQSMGAGIAIAAAGRVFEGNRQDALPVKGVVVEGAYRLGMQPVEGYFRKRGMPLWPYWVTVAGHLSFWYTRASLFDRAMHAGKLRCPLLAFHSCDDETCPVTAADEIVAAAKAAGNEAKLVTFDQPGHLDLAMLDEPRYLAALDWFFDQVNQPRASSPDSNSQAGDTTHTPHATTTQGTHA